VYQSQGQKTEDFRATRCAIETSIIHAYTRAGVSCGFDVLFCLPFYAL